MEGVSAENLPVQALIVRKEHLTPSVSVLGTIEYFEKATITSKSTGRIQAFYRQEGDRVHKGDPLVQIEKLPLELDLAKNEAAVNAAESQYRLAREKFDIARRSIEMRLKEIDKHATQVKDLKSQLAKARAMYAARQSLYKMGGISREEYTAMKTELISSEAKYLTAKRDYEIASIGYRPEDLRAKGIPVPDDSVARKEAFVDLNTRAEKAEVEVAEANIQSAKASRKSTAMLLSESTIRSPLNGVVASKSKSIGEQVIVGFAGNSDQGIMVVVDIDRLYVRMNIPESEVPTLKEGTKLNFASDVFPGKDFSARVKIISPVIDEKSHTFEVKALLQNAGHLLIPGMFVRAKLTTGVPEDLILLPSSAILPVEGNLASIFVIQKGLLKRKEIKTGRLFEEKIEILSGLDQEEIVAIEKLPQLRDGLAVKPIVSNPSSNQ